MTTQKISLPDKPKIIKQEKNLAVFEIKPCFPGYGVTLGNAFRRVLLSSLPGAAVTKVKIEGVPHEFSTIENIKEDAIQIILNLKELKFKMHTDDPITLDLKIKGEKKVTAKDIKVPSNLEIINPDQPIATLTAKKAQLNMEITVEKGLGYVSADDRQADKKDINAIVIDANFTPIERVNYQVENMRVGKRTDFNKLTIEIETNGMMSPKEAFTCAADLLVEQFGAFANPQKQAEVKAKISKEAEKAAMVQKKTKKTKAKTKKSKNKNKKKKQDIGEMKVSQINLDTRTINSLHSAHIKSVSRLAQKTEEQLLEIEGIGDKGVKIIRRELGKLGIILRKK